MRLYGDMIIRCNGVDKNSGYICRINYLVKFDFKYLKSSRLQY